MHIVVPPKSKKITIVIRQPKPRLYCPPRSGAGVHLDRRFRRQRTRKAAFAAALG